MEKPLLFQVITAVIAVLAFIRPELSRLTRRWTNKLVFHFPTRMEIGFSGYGPTVGVAGSVVAQRGDHLVTDMKVVVTRARDSARYTFEWVAFRSTNLFVSADKMEAAVTSAFTMKHREFKQVNIQYHDVGTRARYEGELLQLRSSFKSFVEKNNIDPTKLNPEQTLALLNRFDVETSKSMTKAMDLLRQHFYWEPGQYYWTLSITTNAPRKRFEFTRGFSLSRQESDTLSSNIGLMVIGLTVQPQVQFNFAFPVIEQTKAVNLGS